MPNTPMEPSMSLLCKLGSIVQHTDEMLSSDGHQFDKMAIDSLLHDPAVVASSPTGGTTARPTETGGCKMPATTYRAFDDVQDTPCPVCLELARDNVIQARAVMPLAKFPARLKSDNRLCCRDCQATETMQRMGFQHPAFPAARLTVANERCEGLTMPPGVMEHFGLCAHGYIRPCSQDDPQAHLRWLADHGIPPGLEWPQDWPTKSAHLTKSSQTAKQSRRRRR